MSQRGSSRRASVLEGLVLSTTQLDENEKVRLGELVERMGGTLTGTFDDKMFALVAGTLRLEMNEESFFVLFRVEGCVLTDREC